MSVVSYTSPSAQLAVPQFVNINTLTWVLVSVRNLNAVTCAGKYAKIRDKFSSLKLIFFIASGDTCQHLA